MSGNKTTNPDAGRQDVTPLSRATEEDRLRRIRILLAKPMHKRTNFLRKKLPNGGSCL